VALDRDGTLIHDEEGYFGRKDDWKKKVILYNGAAKAIKALNKFAKVIVTTNQIGVARGFFGPERVKEINLFIDKILRKEGATIDGWYFSPYVQRKWAIKNGLKLDTPWVVDEFPETRKPEIGMLKLGAKNFGKKLSFYKKIFVIGNSLDDLQMAIKAGGIGIFFKNGKNDKLLEKVKNFKSSLPGKIFLTDDLISSAKIIKKLLK
jgi:D-glycero-D-manno-heptose 1,7-bisphosphate phosphatase